jgi:hypothetical protein
MLARAQGCIFCVGPYIHPSEEMMQSNVGRKLNMVVNVDAIKRKSPEVLPTPARSGNSSTSLASNLLAR